MESTFSSRRRNYMLESHRRDRLIEWMKEILHHGFVLDAPATYADSFTFFEDLIREHRTNPNNSRLKTFVPSIGKFHTHLRLKDAWEVYDSKYSVSQRRNVPPSFNELRHILNLAQVMSIGNQLQFISFDGDQTLYTDGGNFEDNPKLASSINYLLREKVGVAVITAAGYGLDGAKYAIRLRGLLDTFVENNLTPEEVARFYVFGGECNYLLQGELQTLENGTKAVSLVPVSAETWETLNVDDSLNPKKWAAADVKAILDCAEATIHASVQELRLRAKVLRKERAVGMFPGGDSFTTLVPKGHGSKKLKREALDEVVLRVLEELRTMTPPPSIPFCVFNGGRDAWVDIGNKGVAVAVLQSLLKVPAHACLHVGDQFLSAGNDIAAREMCPCIWITSPSETEKILEHLVKAKRGPPNSDSPRPYFLLSNSNSNSSSTGRIVTTPKLLHLQSVDSDQQQQQQLDDENNNRSPSIGLYSRKRAMSPLPINATTTTTTNGNNKVAATTEFNVYTG